MNTHTPVHIQDARKRLILETLDDEPAVIGAACHAPARERPKVLYWIHPDHRKAAAETLKR